MWRCKCPTDWGDRIENCFICGAQNPSINESKAVTQTKQEVDQAGRRAADYDREALLQAVVDCWPHKAHMVGDECARLLDADGIAAKCLYLDSKHEDGDVSFWLLDEMEKADYRVWFFRMNSASYRCVWVENTLWGVGPDAVEEGTHWRDGKTRAEAIAKAFVAVFGKGNMPEESVTCPSRITDEGHTQIPPLSPFSKEGK